MGVKIFNPLRSTSLCLDTSALIYHLEDVSPYSDFTEQIFRSVAVGTTRCVISSLSVAEIFTKPFAQQNQAVISIIENFLLTFPGLEIIPTSYSIARKAAELRAKYRLKTPDAIIVATGLMTSCEGLVANDKQWKRLAKENINIVILDEQVNIP